MASGELDISAADLSIDASANSHVTIDANHHSRVMDDSAAAGASLTLAHLTLRNGSVTTYGGGIFSKRANLTLTNSTVSGNRAGYGGGIFTHGSVKLSNCTVSDNTANDYVNLTGDGGGISSGGVTLTNSTVSGNSAAASGGGIHSGRITVNNSIVAGNTQHDGGDIFGGTASGGHNLIGNVANLDLGPLQNNGGFTRTMLPQAGSAAIDAIACTDAPTMDQRGMTRPDPGSTSATPCDIGAVEANSGFALTVIATGSGSVSAAALPTPLSGGIANCTRSGGNNCAAVFADASPAPDVTLTAAAAIGSFFSAWGGDCVAANSNTSATITMDQGRSCTAAFVNTATTTSIVSPTPTSTTVGSSVQVYVAVTRTADSVVPTAGSVTVNDSTDGTSCSFTLSATANNVCQLPMASFGSKSLSATFTSADTAHFVNSTSTNFTVQVNKIAQSAQFTSTPPGNAVYQGAAYTVSASATSGLPVALSIDPAATAVCSLSDSTSGSAVSFTGVGSCIIDANQVGDATHSAATQAQQMFAVDPAPQAISGFAPTSVTYSAGGTFTATATGGASGEPVTFASTSPGVCTTSGANGAMVTIVTAGTCALTANQLGNANYTAAPATPFSVVVAAATGAITNFAANPASPTYAPNGTFTVSATGSGSTAPLMFASTTPSVCTVSGNTVSIVTAGTCMLTANQAGDGNYVAATPVTLNVTIGQATAAITNFAANPASPTYAVGGTFVLSATGSGSSKPIIYASTTPSVCTVSDATVAILAAGTCTLTANQAGDGNFAAATAVTLNVMIAQASQSISFTSPGNQMLTTHTLSLDPIATSGLPVTLLSSTPSVCTVAGNGPFTVTFNNIGTCTLTASQAGNGNYAAAPPVSVSFDLGIPSVPVPTLNRWALLLLGLLLGMVGFGWRRRIA